MDTTDNTLYLSINEQQKQSIINALAILIDDEYIKENIGWSWNRLTATGVNGSAFDTAHRPGHVCLRRLIGQTEISRILKEQSIPETAVFQVDEQGRLSYAYQNLSSREHQSVTVTVTYFSTPVDITDAFTGLVDFEEDLKLLAQTARLTGGFVTSSKQIAIGQWLRFHGVAIPITEEGARELLDLLTFATLPNNSPYGNYWQLLDSPKDSPFELTEENRSIIRDTIELYTEGEIPLATLYGRALQVEAESPDTLPSGQSYRLKRLIDITVLLADQGQAYIDALGWFADKSGALPTEQFIEQLLIAVMLLDLDPDLDSANTSFAGFDLYAKHHLLARPSEVRAQLENHLVSQCKLDNVIAPLVAEWVLGGMAPEYLALDHPSNLRIGTLAWVVFTQAVHFAEAIEPGVSRSMTYQHLLGFAQASELTPELKAVFAANSADPVITWALMNTLIARNSEGDLSQQAVTLAMEEYQQQVDMMTSALSDLGSPLPQRKSLALKELISRVPDCDPDELLVKHRGTGGGAGRKVSIVDLYLGDELHTEEWDRVNGSSVYQTYPDLVHLYPVAGLYEQVIHNHHIAMTDALSAIIKVTFSQLGLLDRQFIEEGHLGLYCVQDYTTTRFTDIANPVHATRPLTPLPGKTGRYGVLICAALDSELRCYQLFPMRMECVYSEELSKIFRPLVMTDGATAKAVFVDHKSPLEGRLDIQAFRANTAPRSDYKSAFFIRKIGEFNTSSADADTTTPNRNFRSTRKAAIADLIAKENPYFTELELTQLGLDQTEREKAIERTDALFTFILNLIIPFKECVEELSSGDASRQRGAILGCVMDAASLFVSVAAVGIKVAAISTKATTLVSKLLLASKVVAATTLSLFNPVDGVPQLLKGGGKLLGRGVKKLGAHALSFPHLAQRQLRYLAGSNTYELLRAVEHTGSATQIRMSLDTVSHARAVFKADDIETTHQVLKHLRTSDAKLLKTIPGQELQHLLENSLLDIALKSEPTRRLKEVMASDVVEALVRQQAAKYSLDNLHQFPGYTDLPEIFGHTLQVEYKNLTAMRIHQNALITQDLGKAPYNGVLDEAAFNPGGLTGDNDRACAWILKASSSRNEADAIKDLLREYSSNTHSLTDPLVYNELHRAIAPGPTGQFRSPTAQARYPSSVSGAALLEKHLTTLDPASDDFARQLLGAFLGYHSFVDGNGRTARAIYAITELRKGRFNPPSLAAENALSGLS
ncbi:hypothetical protein [Pseudomonas sp.]|uniref:hypothetical protein n=1 Tax=Pseudomonas sp. TaxID=306 RepID=UPI003F2A503C